MNAQTRWQKAQAYEAAWWRRRQGDFDHYERYAAQLTDIAAPWLTIGATTTILEIGPGPGGILTHLPAGTRVAVEPLNDLFAAMPAVQAFRDPAVVYHPTPAENLPMGPQTVDLVIMDNVLDHCMQPQQVLDEIDRVLRPDGLIFLRQNVYHLWGRAVRSLMERFVVDPGHPHTFGPDHMLQNFSSRQWQILAGEPGSYAATWWDELSDFTPKELTKALLFVTRRRDWWLLQKGSTAS